MQYPATKLTKTLGDIIKNHREKTGKSIYKISAESFMPKATWYRIETGKYKDINLTSLFKISEGLEIPLDALIKELTEKLGKDFSISEE